MPTLLSGLAVGQVPVYRRAADAEGPGDLGGAFAAFASCSGRSEFVSVHHGRAAAVAALGARDGRPAMVRSWIMSRSSSANAATMVKKNLPSPVGE